MSATGRPLVTPLALALVGLLVASGCGRATPSGEVAGADGLDRAALSVPVNPEPTTLDLATGFDLEGTTIWVGSDTSTTDTVLGAVAVEALRAAGAEVEDRLGIDGATLARESLLSGEIDLYWEGMGTAWTSFLREPETPRRLSALHEALSARDFEDQGIVWLTPAAADDTRAIATSVSNQEALGIDRLTELEEPFSERDDLVLCATAAFVTFPEDGLVDLEDSLDLDLTDQEVRVYDPEPIYADTATGSCTFGVVERLSGRVASYDLVLLEDDADVFLPNHPAPAVREDLILAEPDLVPLFAALAPALDEATVRALAEQVEIDGEDPLVVARRWLVDEGFVR